MRRRARPAEAGAPAVSVALISRLRRSCRQLALQLVLERVELRAARHLLDELVARDLALAPVAPPPPAIEDHEAIADRIRVMRIVGDEDHAEPAVARLGDVAQHDT